MHIRKSEFLPDPDDALFSCADLEAKLREAENRLVDAQLERDDECLRRNQAETALAAFRAFVHAYDLAEDAWELKPARNHARAAVEPFLRDDDV